jgi:DNA-binding NtrC family response regulator/tetratricopeptide (TPR) repeat protein
LILGETGTGKGLLARSIHDAGPRAAGPFVAVNCAAIPETLLEAELFGFEQGAFTDARHAKAGLFQSANRGTLFLDEIGLLPQSLQAKLLTVLEDRTVRRLGSTRSEPVDVWIISATSEDLKAGARRRRFREELYHRLAVVTLHLPALRERGPDILVLAEHFLARTCSDYGLPPKSIADDARAALLAYRWPGNVRELANLMERVTLLLDTHRVTAASLELENPRDRPSIDDGGIGVQEATSLEQAVGEVERARIRQALQATGWNISHAAERLGVTRNTLRYRLTKYGLRASSGPTEPSAPVEPTSPTVAHTAAPSVVDVHWARRHVALLRADIAAASSVGALPEVTSVLKMLVEKVLSFGGQVEDVSPRGLLAGFGIEAVEDGPRRAAHAALAIQKGVEQERGRSSTFPDVRVSLHVGEGLVASVGGVVRLDHEAKREAWTRLEALIGTTSPGTVLMSEETRPFLDRLFIVAPIEARLEALTKAYQLSGLRRTALGLGERLTPLVGRDREMERLALSLEQVQKEHGQVVCVVGDAGVGKSRLIWEFIESHRGQDSVILLGRAASYGQATPYLPVIDLLKGYFQIEARDDTNSIGKKVTEKLSALGRALAPALSPVLALFDAAVHDEHWGALDPAQRQRRTLDAIKLLLVEHSRRQVVIVVFEDLHWIDSKTQAMLETLVESIPSHRALLLLSYRPEYQHAWSNKGHYAQLRLDPLSPDDAHAMLDHLMGREITTAPVKAALVERTGGNPFFLEESVRAAVETSVLVGGRGNYRLARSDGQVRIPPTVQAVLAERIERLAPEDKGLLQTAAVIGKDVPLALLARVADTPAETLQARLARLQGSEFLYETKVIPEREFAFKHALSHEAVYAGVLDDRRRALHARIMEAIEELHGDRLAEHVDRLAHHALRGAVWAKAVNYFRQAGTKSFTRSAYREAVACFEHAIAALAHLPESHETIELGIDLRLELRRSVFPLGEFRRLFEHLRQGEILAERLGDRRRLGWISACLSHYFWVSSDLDSAVRLGDRALDVAEAERDLALGVVAHQRLGQAYLNLGHFRRACDHLRSNVETLQGDLVREMFGESGPLSVLSRVFLVRALAERGDFAEGIVRGEEGVRIAEMADHPYSRIGAYFALGFLHLRKGDFKAAVDFLERSCGLCENWRMPRWFYGAAQHLGYAYVLSGRLADGVPLLERSIHESVAMGHGLSNALPSVYLSDAYRIAGRIEDAADLAARALQFVRDKRGAGLASALLVLAEIASHRDPIDAESAEIAYRQALVLAEELGMRPLCAHCHLGLGKLLGLVDKREEAREHLVIATAMYREMEMRFWLEQAEAKLVR